MKRLLLVLMLAGASGCLFAQDLGIGIRVGEPSGFSIKKYLSGNRAFEVSIGSTGYIYNRSLKQGQYIIGGLAVMGNYLQHKEIQAVKNLSVYYGAGAATKIRSFRYEPEFAEASGTATRFSFSVNGVAGLEYTFDQAPVSIFLDILPYVEVTPYPGVLGMDGGLGVRYNF